MAPPDTDPSRSARLSKYFDQVLAGKRAVKNAEDGKRFLEAICDQKNASSSVEKLIASAEGLNSLQRSLRFDVLLPFLNGLGAEFVNYLADDTLKQLCNGQFLHQIIAVVVEPPTFWNALSNAHKARTLSANAVQAFAWLLLELLSSKINGCDVADVRAIAESVTQDKSLLNSPVLDVRTLGHKIKSVLLITSVNASHIGNYRPGGRHDNDFEDFREIAILPTADEFTSSEKPFYVRADAIEEKDSEQCGAAHLDNQFRLLREDFLGELRNDLQIASGQKKGRRTGSMLKGLSLEGIYCDPDMSRKPCCLTFKPQGDFWQLQKLSIPKRKAYIKENRNFMKHQSFGCLMNGNELLAFATVERDEDLLAQKPPIIVLNISGETAFTKILIAAKTSKDLKFVQVDTAIFAYEPILKRLQEKTALPLAEELFRSDLHQGQEDSDIKPTRIIERIRERGSQDLQSLLNTPKSVELDSSQLDSLVMGLEKRLSLIQGPPGTGKSFIGALITKILHDHSNETILIICYTNHALDQFLEDLMDIGIEKSAMVRLGSKSTARTESLNISKQSSNFKRSQTSWDIINKSKMTAEAKKNIVSRLVNEYRNSPVSKKELLEYLEFVGDEAHFYPALSVPEDDDGMIPVGRDGKKIPYSYLLDRWESGQDAGIFKIPVSEEHSQVWKMNHQSRKDCIARWSFELLKERATNVYDQVRKFDECQETRSNVWNEKNAAILKEKRIIGCTTTAAAMYAKELEGARPGVILVEEAGEILESHILTAMTPNTKQLVLIGDHKQLRPKVNNYGLTVEKGDGYNLNVSLFERLVLAGVPHTTLSAQHRMSPEISALVRHLTYPKLLDAPKTMGRPPIRGMQDRVVFFNHDHPELEATDLADRRDEESKSSKENAFEVEMVLKCVKYLGQQGYGTDKLVVLTPYLGQLRLLLNELRKENDPVLNDLDSYDLIRAGLLPAAAANIQKGRIRISTIDNYQGEESDIVISTLTRSNPRGDIGFMSSPQRLNVLLSRARNGLIMIGNAATFMESRRGKDVWLPLFDYLKSHGHIYGGLPVKCERHKSKTRVLEKKEDFDIHCPDGGCDEPCGTKLNCGVHDCPQRCHQIYDHTKMQCQHPLQMVCSKNHKMRWICHQGAPPTCQTCDREARELERKQKRDHQLEKDREAKQKAYEKELTGLKAKIDFERRLRKDMQDDEERARVLAQYKKDLEDVKQEAKNGKQSSIPPISVVSSNYQKPAPNMLQTPDAMPPNAGEEVRSDNTKPMDVASAAKDEWEHQKKFEGASNKELDTLMSMTGLENVKQQFLGIKGKIDTAIRQKTNLKDERFGAAFLGNPGTGKTTVARLYAGFLAAVGVLPGDCFIETTGSRLSNDGINGCKKHIEDILNNGGGALFVDEAYQLVSANNYGGTQVLDFLLAEIENLTGKMVVILAGYNKQMEAFFAHNPGLPSRIPYQLQFEDYGDSELLQILQSQIEKKYNGNMKVEDGLDGLYMRIVARRIGRGRGRDGFGNARAVHNAFAQIADRQAKRLQKERRASPPPDDMLLKKVDLLGQEPSGALKNSKAWTELQGLIGLKSVKESVRSLFDSIKANYDRELEEMPLVEYSLNKVFLGSPGTGKTSVGKLYGQILADIGLLTSGEVVVKNPADFVGDALGRSESQTKGILASTVGKVLIIDEAYMLGAGAGGGGTSTGDPYKTAVIDTIVAEVQSTPGDDRCVLLLGYKEQMEEMFQNVNPGLSRRFPISSGFVFEDFIDSELRQILELKLKKQGFKAADQAKDVAMDVLRRARNKPHFGNAGEVDILLDKAKACHQKRLSSGKSKKRDVLEPLDFDEDFDRGKRASTNIRMLFKDVIGCDAIVAKLEGYQNAAANLTAMGEDPREQIPFSFLFRGPPGTGKTTTAKKMGKVYYDMGFLATAEVVECSASELVGQYVGQTGPKTQKLLERALGKVLFVDEAYRLAEGHFAKEAMDEIVACLTNPKFAQKLVVILAGYDEDINRLMSINPGLTSRFPEAIVFNHLSPDECTQLLASLFQSKRKLNSEILRTFPGNLRQNLTRYFEELIDLPAWGNARDVHTLVKSIWGKLISTPAPSPTGLLLTEDVINEAFSVMISERSHRAQSESKPSDIFSLSGKVPQPPTQHLETKAPDIQTTVNTATITAAARAPTPPPPPQAHPAPADAHRDAGVSDAIWAQLQHDKAAAEARHIEQERILQRYEELKAAQTAETEGEQENVTVTAEDDYARRMHELARLEHVKALLERQKELEELERRRKAVMEERKKEEKAQAKLRQMGVCVAGYRWIKQASGYRCEAGGHFVSDAQLGLS